VPRQFDLLVFDWDGTLMDSAGAISSSLRAACADMGLEVPSDESARYVIGLGLDDALAHVVPGLPRNAYPALLERYRYHFLKQDGGTTLFEGAHETLAALREQGFLLAVATGKSRRGLDRALDASDSRQYFHATRCADESFSKPNPTMLLWLLDELQVPSERTLMIGDTSHDMEMAAAAQVPRLGVSYGAHPRGNLLKHAPVACVDTFDELHRWLTTKA
jgi:phosphoglycolate phosphatase